MWILLLGPREISVILKLQFHIFSFPPSNLHYTVMSIGNMLSPGEFEIVS